MFHLLTIEDRVRIPPNNFNSEVQTIEDEIEKKYVSKVVLDGGLFIALYDILGTGDSYVYPGDGAAHLMVRFRMVVFKPFKGEIMEGVIKKSTKDQVQITLGFYDEIYLNPIELPTPSSFSEEESLWYWDWNDNQLFFENGGRIRFRVEQIEFNPEVSQPAPAPKNLNTDGMDSYTLKEYKERQLENERLLQQVKSPMILKVSVKDSGLGMVEWWTGQDTGNDDDDDDDQQQQQQDEDEDEDEDNENYQMNEEYSNKNNFDEGEGVEDAEDDQILINNNKDILEEDEEEEEEEENNNIQLSNNKIFNDVEEEEQEEEQEEEEEEEVIETKSKRKSSTSKKDRNKKSTIKKESKKKSKKEKKKSKKKVISSSSEEEESQQESSPSEESQEESSEEEIKKPSKSSKGRKKKN